MLYRVLRFLISIGIRIFYSEIKINGLNNLPSKGPLIIIVNHPNTLMDAWVIGMICKQPIYYMAKATLFKTKFRLRILKSLNLIPINRQGEGKISGVENDDSLEKCYEILANKKTLMIFPEGTSYQEMVLRKLKTGTARIALEAEKRSNGKLNLQIIAVGLNYSQPEKFRSKLLINIDKPRGVLNYLEEYQIKAKPAAQKLTDELRKRLEKVLFTTETKEEQEQLLTIQKILNTKYSTTPIKGVTGKFFELKEIKDQLDELKITAPEKATAIQLKLRAITWKLDKLKIKADFLDRKLRSIAYIRQLILSTLFLLIGIPLFIFGAIHNMLPYHFTDWAIPKLSKDIEYYAPFAVFIGIFIYPLNYAIFILCVTLAFDLAWMAILIYAILLPFSGLYSYWFLYYLKHIKFKWRYMLLFFDRKEMLQELQLEKKRLYALLYE